MARIDRLGHMVHGDEYTADEVSGDQDERKYRTDTDRLRDPDVQSQILAQPDRNRVVVKTVCRYEQDDRERPPRWKAGDEYLREIFVPMELTQKQIERRRVLDQIEAFMKALFVELSHFTDDGRRPTEEWMNVHQDYIDVAMSMPRVRDLARGLISSVAYEMREPPAGAPDIAAPTRVPVSVEFIAENWEPLILYGITFSFCRKVTDEVQARKNGVAAAVPPSGQPSYSARSATTSRALRRRRSRAS